MRCQWQSKSLLGGWDSRDEPRTKGMTTPMSTTIATSAVVGQATKMAGSGEAFLEMEYTWSNETTLQGRFLGYKQNNRVLMSTPLL